MVQFDESDLFYKDYINTITNDYNPDYIAIEDFENVNPKERFEMIFFCDAYLKRYKLDKDIANFQKVEKIVRSRFPHLIIPKKELYLYVAQNWYVESNTYIKENSLESTMTFQQ